MKQGLAISNDSKCFMGSTQISYYHCDIKKYIYTVSDRRFLFFSSRVTIVFLNKIYLKTTHASASLFKRIFLGYFED